MFAIYARDGKEFDQWGTFASETEARDFLYSYLPRCGFSIDDVNHFEVLQICF